MNREKQDLQRIKDSRKNIPNRIHNSTSKPMHGQNTEHLSKEGLRKLRFKRIIRLVNRVIALVNIVVILFLVLGYITTRQNALNTIDEFDKEIAMIENTEFVFNVKVIDTVPVKLDIPLSEVLDLERAMPESVRIKDSIPINTTVKIDKDVTTTVNIPMAGKTTVTVPIETTVPIRAIVPVDTEVDLTDTVIENQMIHFEKNIPISMDFTTKKSINQMGLAAHLDQLHNILNSLRILFMAKPKKLSDFQVNPDETDIEYVDLILKPQ